MSASLNSPSPSMSDIIAMLQDNADFQKFLKDRKDDEDRQRDIDEMLNDLGMAMFEYNREFYEQEARIFDDQDGDDEDEHQVKPGIGETVKNFLSEAIKYVGQRLAGLFGRS
jgi:hypothetical protein